MDKLLNAAKAASGEDKFVKFNKLVYDFGAMMVEEGMCRSYRVIEQEPINILILEGYPYQYGELPTNMRDSVINRFNTLVHSCGISDEEFKMSDGKLDWDFSQSKANGLGNNVMDRLIKDASEESGEDKFVKFNRLIIEFGNILVSEGTCKDFIIEQNNNDMDTLILDARPLHYSELSDECHKRVASRFHSIMYACGITDDEYNESHGGFKWLMMPDWR